LRHMGRRAEMRREALPHDFFLLVDQRVRTHGGVVPAIVIVASRLSLQ
jgi:hypothetical protein